MRPIKSQSTDEFKLLWLFSDKSYLAGPEPFIHTHDAR
jgi:hypothetical protein